MSSELVTDIQFTDQAFRTGVNAKKLNLAFSHAVIQPAFVADKPVVGAYASGDYLLLLKADGTYAKIPPSAVSTGGGTGSGDMLKSVYDTNNNGTVDTADSLAWSRLTGVPATFPPDSTAMTKAVYDTNGNNVVDTCDSLAWSKVTGTPATYPSDWNTTANKPATFSPSAHASTHLAAGSDPIALASATLAGLCPAVDNTTIQVVTSKLSCVALAWTAITGKPSTFPPDSTAMLKSVYDTNADNIVDHAALADTAPWTGISGKPASFAPSAHAPSHLDNGADPIPVATTSRTGLVPILNGNSGTFLNGTGVFSAPAGGGDMLRSVYDTNANNVVDTCDSLPWTSVTGRPIAGFIIKSAAYTLLAADSGQYIICSGGSWTLTLPTAAAGLYYQVRNDMGISGTVGTITIARAGSATIDGLTSIALLPQQECTIFTDGTNWRVFGLKREVILGTQDITSSTANGIVLLPAGYRYFELDFEAFSPVTADGQLLAQISFDGGSTWQTGNYYFGILYNSSTTAAANFQSVNAAACTLSGGVNGGPCRGKVVITPGAVGKNPSYSSDFGTWTNTSSLETTYRSSGWCNASGLANALKYYVSSGNIASSQLTVKGVV